MQIKNTRTFGIEESIIAGGYPMMTEWPIDQEFNDQQTAMMAALHSNEEVQEEYIKGNVFTQEQLDLAKKGINRTKKLGKVPTGTGHDNVLKGMIVQYDVKYPQFWTPQFQRYSFHDIVSSSSKMHRLQKMDVKTDCNKYVDDVVIDNLRGLIGIFNGFKPGVTEVKVIEGEYQDNFGGGYPFELHSFDDGKTLLDFKGREVKKSDHMLFVKETVYTKYEMFMRVVSNAPLGLEQFMRVTSSYLQLKTIYLQRKDHKLKEDWGKYCAWCESLPYFVEFALEGKRKFTDEDGKVLDPMFDWR